MISFFGLAFFILQCQQLRTCYIPYHFTPDQRTSIVLIIPKNYVMQNPRYSLLEYSCCTRGIGFEPSKLYNYYTAGNYKELVPLGFSTNFKLILRQNFTKKNFTQRCDYNVNSANRRLHQQIAKVILQEVQKYFIENLDEFRQ